MKKISLVIGTFINSILILINLFLSAYYEVNYVQNQQTENVSAILFLPVVMIAAGIFFFLIDVFIAILAAVYLKDSRMKLTAIHVNKMLDVLQIIMLTVLLTGASIFAAVHNWFGVILSIFLISQFYFYIMWFWNIYQEKRKNSYPLRQ